MCIPIFIQSLPHGVFELSARFIAWGIGLWQAKFLFSPDDEGAKKPSLIKLQKVYMRASVFNNIQFADIKGADDNRFRTPDRRAK